MAQVTVAQAKSLAVTTGSFVKTVSFTSTPTAGRLIGVMLRTYDTTPQQGSIYDNQGNTYTLRVVNNDVDVFCAIFTGKAVTSSGTFTVTYDPSNADNYSQTTMAIVELVNADADSPVDVSGSSNDYTASPTANIPNTTANEALVLGAVALRSGAPTVGAGWTAADGNQYCIYKEAATAGAHDPTWTCSITDWAAVGVAIKAAAGASTVPPTIRHVIERGKSVGRGILRGV